MIELKNVSRIYPMGQEGVHALREVSLKIGAGEFVAIMGPSGSGKSTMLQILGFLDRPDKGSYFLGKKDISRLDDDELSVIRNHIAGFVFQQARRNVLGLSQVMHIHQGDSFADGQRVHRGIVLY